jgi:hypothetical protein
VFYQFLTRSIIEKIRGRFTNASKPEIHSDVSQVTPITVSVESEQPVPPEAPAKIEIEVEMPSLTFLHGSAQAIKQAAKQDKRISPVNFGATAYGSRAIRKFRATPQLPGKIRSGRFRFGWPGGCGITVRSSDAAGTALLR